MQPCIQHRGFKIQKANCITTDKSMFTTMDGGNGECLLRGLFLRLIEMDGAKGVAVVGGLRGLGDM